MLYLGDCIEVLKTLPDNSVDSVVTDPPYGLEFMGKEWDKLEPNRNGQRWADTERELIKPAEFKDFKALPSYRPKRNAKCKTCGHYRFSGTPCKCEEPNWDDRMNEHAELMQAWHLEWAREVLRVLKPGGHLLSFGGTRTYHRMACAIEDAGFEIRDQMQWLYGSGFPKSYNISKGIDKMAEVSRACCRGWILLDDKTTNSLLFETSHLLII
jgi:DNA modification methylase